MTLLVDSGNSRLHVSWWDNSEIIEPASIQYPTDPDDLDRLIQSVVRGSAPERVAACSVNARWREPLFNVLEHLNPGRFHAVRSAEELGIAVCYADPCSMGIDRALAGFAAWRFFGEPCVVVDAGTAITVDAVGKEGAMTGGYIVPGFETMSRALVANAGLPSVEGDPTSEIPGDSTLSCIRNGIAVMVREGVKRLVELAADHAGASRILVTGGGGESLMGSLPFHAGYRPWLVLEGLGLALDENRLPLYISV